MNVIDHYKKELLNLGDPQPIDDDDDMYFAKFNYNYMPFMIKTNKICGFKPIKKNKDNYVNISITSQEYLVWFETFYKWCIQTVHERSEDWFEEQLSLSDVEFSFVNPLKSNIKHTCFDIQCTTDEDRLHIVDTKDNVNSLDSLTDCNIIPTFHIKGIKFNNKFFALVIELNNMLVILEDPDSDTEIDVESNGANVLNVKDIKDNVNKSSSIHNEENIKRDVLNVSLEKENDLNENGLNEVTIPTDDLEEMSMDIESNGFYKIYEILDEKIKDNVIQNLQKIFNKKKIKLNVDLTDIFDEED
jgi:hypothetical protein